MCSDHPTWAEKRKPHADAAPAGTVTDSGKGLGMGIPAPAEGTTRGDCPQALGTLLTTF